MKRLARCFDNALHQIGLANLSRPSNHLQETTWLGQTLSQDVCLWPSKRRSGHGLAHDKLLNAMSNFTHSILQCELMIGRHSAQLGELIV